MNNEIFKVLHKGEIIDVIPWKC